MSLLGLGRVVSLCMERHGQEEAPGTLLMLCSPQYLLPAAAPTLILGSWSAGSLSLLFPGV